uniref:Uncharacterized protein n=1 Tax=Cacopsylla melanoneura TaxID=428564 RepID=A0A8D8PSS5_9HEMI
MTMERIIFTEEKNGQNMLETCQNMHKICKKKMANILCTKHAKTMFYYVVYEKSSKYVQKMHYMPKHAKKPRNMRLHIYIMQKYENMKNLLPILITMIHMTYLYVLG